MDGNVAAMTKSEKVMRVVHQALFLTQGERSLDRYDMMNLNGWRQDTLPLAFLAYGMQGQGSLPQP